MSSTRNSRAELPKAYRAVLGDPWAAVEGGGVRRTRIVNTIGPSSSSPEILERMIRAGTDVARINFSHVRDFETAQSQLDALELAMARAGRRIAVLADLRGPKVRVDDLPTPVVVTTGGIVALVAGESADENTIPLNPAHVLRDIAVGDAILIDDGQVALEVVATEPTGVRARVVRGGTILPRKGINLPRTDLTERVPTAEDRASIDIVARLRPPITRVAVSFVRDGADLDAVRAALDEAYLQHGNVDDNGRPHRVSLIAKVERAIALEPANLRSIFEKSDGVMVARGDLGVEIGIERVPIEEVRMHRLGNQMGVITGTATQMLESMTDGGPPTRAEAADVARSVMDGAEFVMTSGETAVGVDPVGVVETMARIIATTEEALAEEADPRIGV